jgi:hypothetical protein
VIFHLRGGAFSLFRGGLRLVLAGFLLFAFLWGVAGFVATFINQTSSLGCQVAVALAAGFDQMARVTLQEFLFWTMKSDTRAAASVILAQVVIFLRVILGGVFVGVQRPQFAPVCVTTNLLWPLGVAVLCMDTFIVIALLTRASSVGVLYDLKAEGPVRSRSRGIVFTTIGLAAWIPVCPALFL